MKNAFTVDVEDGISIAMRDAFGKKIPQTERVVSNTERVLHLLDKYEVKGTFFVLGQVARDFPSLIKKISHQGHEVGVHGFNHWTFDKLTPSKARRELTEAKALIEDTIGKQTFGHRAPAFSVTPETEWALDVIAEVGFKYDSSIMPCKTRNFGWPGFSKNIGLIKTKGGNEIIEAPMPVTKVFSKEIPVCGGGYLRLFPQWFNRRAFEAIQKSRPMISYIHPYEFDPDRYPDYFFDEMKKGGLKSDLKFKFIWFKRSTVYGKLEDFLKNYEFDTLWNIMQNRVNI